MKKKLTNILNNTLDLCFREGYLKKMPVPGFVIEVPNNPDHGHFATNLAMILAKKQKNSPRNIAEIIIQHLIDHDHFILKAEIGGAGFINFFVNGRVCECQSYRPSPSWPWPGRSFRRYPLSDF
ncbi:MAG: hypothetical protein JRJ45_15010 [Deltaproteobacteria bacterium]|nr:hypothetical protein [Deltaproteobacteria bacterium]